MVAFDDLALDDARALAGTDASGLLVELASAGARLRAAVALTGEATLDRLAVGGRPRSLVVVADPSGWTAAEAVLALAGARCPVPVVRAGGDLPPWVGAADLVLALSGSGTGRPTGRAAAAARRRGAWLLAAAPAASPLADAASGPGATHLPTALEGAGLPSLWGPLAAAAVALSRLGLLDVPPGDLVEAADALDAEGIACRPASETFVNPGKTLAVQLAGTVPLVWAATSLAEVAARRFGRRLAQSAGVAAAVAGAEEALAASARVLVGPLAPDPADLFRDPMDLAPAVRPRVVLLREAGETPEQARTADTLAVEAAATGAGTSELSASDGAPLTRLATLVARLDFAATYLALAYGLDPAARPVTDLAPGGPP